MVDAGKAVVVGGVVSLAHYMLGGPAAYSNSWAAACWSWAGSVAYWCVIGFLTFYVVFRCLDHIVDIYDIAEHMPFEFFLLSVLGLTVLACRYVPRCAMTCGTLAVRCSSFRALFVSIASGTVQLGISGKLLSLNLVLSFGSDGLSFNSLFFSELSLEMLEQRSR